jgi:hypothetical protein
MLYYVCRQHGHSKAFSYERGRIESAENIDVSPLTESKYSRLIPLTAKSISLDSALIRDNFQIAFEVGSQYSACITAKLIHSINAFALIPFYNEP